MSEKSSIRIVYWSKINFKIITLNESPHVLNAFIYILRNRNFLQLASITCVPMQEFHQ